MKMTSVFATALFAWGVGLSGFAARMPVEATWNASLGADNVLRMDSAREREFEWARYAITSGDRAFKPNTRYEISFMARVGGLGPGSYL